MGRYLSQPTESIDSKHFPLLEVKTFRFHSSDVSVIQAVELILRGSGYKLAPSAILDPLSYPMLTSAIASNQRELENISRLAALKALAGPGFELVVDPLTRRVAFDVSLNKSQWKVKR